MKARLFACAAAALLLCACDPAPIDPKKQIGAEPTLPPIHQALLPGIQVQKIVGWGNAMPTVAPGLRIAVFARGLRNPRMVTALPNGDVLVVESQGPSAPVFRPKEWIMGLLMSRAHSGVKAGNRILLFRDSNGDGKPELKSVFLDKLNSPFGVAVVGRDLYVANTDGVMHYAYADGQTEIAEAGKLLTPLPAGTINHHWTKSLTASPDGTKLYAGVGSNSNVAEYGMDAEMDRAAIFEIDRATGARRLYATGLRNPNGLTFEPTTDTLWTVVNERDELGPDLVPDYMTSVQEGGFYGWPYSYYGRHIDPRVMPQRPDLVENAIAPDYALSSHVAPLGLVFYTGDNLPGVYRGGAFVSEHGSWNRKRLNGYKVVFVPFHNSRPNGPPHDVVTGFVADGATRGRPVGLAVDRRGGLLIADDAGGTVWRVTAAK